MKMKYPYFGATYDSRFTVCLVFQDYTLYSGYKKPCKLIIKKQYHYPAFMV